MNLRLGMATLLVLASHLGASSAEQIFRPGDVLRGQYRCAQGETSAVLRVQEVKNFAVGVPGATPVVLGVFEFGSQLAPRGSYRVIGHFDAKQALTIFEPAGWILRPGRYEPVGFTLARSTAVDEFSGHVTFRNCGAISLTREVPSPESTAAASQPAENNSATDSHLELTKLTPTTSLDEFKLLKLPASCKWGKQDVHFYCMTNVAYAGHVPKDGAAVYFSEGRISRIDISAGLAVAPQIRAELDRRYGAHAAEITTHEGSPRTTYTYQSGGTVLVPGPNGGFSEALAPAIAVPSGSIPTTYNKTTYRWKAPCVSATSSYGFATIAFVPCR